MEAIMRDFKQQDPEAVADYSDQDIEDWTETNQRAFDAFIREDPEEGVDVIEKAVRETYPKDLYRSPVGRDTPYIFFETTLPRDVSDSLSAFTRKFQLMMKWKHKSEVNLKSTFPIKVDTDTICRRASANLWQKKNGS